MSDTLTDLGRRALLPAGLRDLLAPNAGNEARLVELLVACTTAHGYERVKPPLSNLSRGELEEIANRTFIPLDIIGERQYVVSLRHGDLLDAKKLFAVLGSDADARTSHSTSPRTGRDASE